MTFASLNSDRIPANVVASRKKATVEALVALHVARNETGAARQTLADETAALAAVEREIAEMAHPGIDDAAIEAHDARKRKLTYKIDGYRLRVEDAQKRLAACDAVVLEAREVVLRASAARALPPVDAPADLPRLKTEYARALEAADKAAAHLAGLEAQAAPVLAACEGLKETGAPRDRAAKLLDEADAWADKIAAALAEHQDTAAAARAAQGRVTALQGRIEAESSRQAFERGLKALEAQRSALDAPIAAYAVAGERMKSLFATCKVWLKALDAENAYGLRGDPDKFGTSFMGAPKFADAARVPLLNADGWFVSSHWQHQHQYEDAGLRLDILAPLKAMIVRGASCADLLRSGAPIFLAEYERIAVELLAPLATLYGWAADRDALFASAPAEARAMAQPELPVRLRHDEDRPWRRLSLPALRVNAAPIWAPDFDPKNLLALTKQAQAA